MGDATRDDGAIEARSAHQPKDGGSLPASSLSFFTGNIDDAKRLVMSHHYSRRWPSNVQVVGTLHSPGGLFGDAGNCVAACVVTIPGTRWSEQVCELARLVRGDVQVPLSLLISLTMKAAKKAGFDLCVSFADRTQGHEGGVYRAASWNYSGCRERQMDGLVVNGELVLGRTCNHTWGTRSPTKLQAMHPTWQIVPHFDEGKHLFWKALNNSGEHKAQRLGLTK